MYSELSQKSKMELFAKIVNGWKLLTNFAKSSILDTWLGSEYASAYLDLFQSFPAFRHSAGECWKLLKQRKHRTGWIEFSFVEHYNFGGTNLFDGVIILILINWIEWCIRNNDTEAYSENWQTSMVEFFYKNN